MALYVCVSSLNSMRWAIGSQWRDWQRGVEPVEGMTEGGVEDTEWRPVEGLAERGGGH
ncbi:unnamed protein product [Staurois parvus]|uniref:Uncharacterized protein n=1 Tax=Staurois parvus TaxID=386267 RepID=A0ABN9HIC0_9NEOB|nr:unnamed protein product [Staurois parvus]